MLNENIKSEIRKIWNALWSGGIANPLSCMEQISYFLFMRRLSVMDDKARGDAEFLDQDHVSIFEGHEDCRWDHFKHLDGDLMLGHVRDVVFPWMKTEVAAQGDLFAQAMGDAVFIIPKGSLMVEMVSTIDRIYELIETEARGFLLRPIRLAFTNLWAFSGPFQRLLSVTYAYTRGSCRLSIKNL